MLRRSVQRSVRGELDRELWTPAGPAMTTRLVERDPRTLSHPWPFSRERGTIVAMTVEPLRTVRDHLSEFVDRAEREHERVVVTRNGRPAAVLIGYEDLAALEETLDILSDPEALAEIRQAEAEVARGEIIEGVEAVRALRPRR